MYYSSFYSFNHPPPDNYERNGRYDIGCGGYCHWYITKNKVKADNFCVKYPNKRYVFIFDPYNKDHTDCEIYHQFIKKYPDLISIDGFWFVAFSDHATCVLATAMDSDDGGGNVYAVDLYNDRSTYCFDGIGEPLWE